MSYTHCNTCNLEIVPEDIVVACEGPCEDRRYFHAKCVGLSYDEGCACLHQNIFWMCDCCRDSIEKGRFRLATNEAEATTYATQKELDSLKKDVERINATVAQMTKNSATATEPINPVVYRPEPHHEHTSPLSSTRLNAVDETTTNDECVQLYVSNIAIDVTEDEVKQLVCDSLGTCCVRSVKCLVPAWKNTSTMTYVSFKIDIDAQFRSAALKWTNWPAGIRCREFRNFDRTPWRPSTRITQHTT